MKNQITTKTKSYGPLFPTKLDFMGIRFLNETGKAEEGANDSKEADKDKEQTDVDSTSTADTQGEPDKDGASSEDGDKETEEKDQDDKGPDKDSTDPDVIPDTEEIKNLGQLRSARNRNKNLKTRLDKAIQERDALKAAGSSDQVKKIEELEKELEEFREGASSQAKKDALKEAGLPEGLASALKGTKEEWEETLKVLIENKPNSQTRVKTDVANNGVPGGDTNNVSPLNASRNLRRRR